MEWATEVLKVHGLAGVVIGGMALWIVRLQKRNDTLTDKLFTILEKSNERDMAFMDALRRK